MSTLPARPGLAGLATGVTVAAGTGLGVLFAAAARVRRSKPLHPVGAMARAVLTVAPAGTRSGSTLLDEPGSYDCLVRASYAVGVGPQHPDIEGFALRVLPGSSTPAMTDVLFASTGVGPLGRHVLTLRPPGVHAAQTTLLPVRAGGRPLHLRLDPRDARTQPWPARYLLSWAHERGAWNPFATLAVEWGEPLDAAERFDPVAHPLPGTSQYAAVARVREPAYRMARLAWPAAGRLPTATRGGGVRA